MNNKRLSIIAVFIGLFLPLKMQAQNQDIIDFEDDAVKAVCVANWDANGDGEMSWQEVSNITDLGKAFTNPNHPLLRVGVFPRTYLNCRQCLHGLYKFAGGNDAPSHHQNRRTRI